LPHLSNVESRKDAQILSGHHASNSEHVSGILHDKVVDYFTENTIKWKHPNIFKLPAFPETEDTVNGEVSVIVFQ
jgi:hypothetical protein